MRNLTPRFQEGSPMRCTFSAIVALLVVSAALAQPGATATSPANPKHIGSRFFKIPFELPQNAQNIRQLKLYLPANGGATWDLNSTAGQFAPQFAVKVDRHGPYA